MKLISRGAFASSRLDRILLCLVLLLGTAAQVAWAQAPQEIETMMRNMLAATQAKSLADFVAGGDASFKSAWTQPMLDSFSTQFAPRLDKGYTATFMGRVNQGGYSSYFWKLEFKDGGDDRLVQMVVKDAKVSGFFLR